MCENKLHFMLCIKYFKVVTKPQIEKAYDISKMVSHEIKN